MDTNVHVSQWACVLQMKKIARRQQQQQQQQQQEQDQMRGSRRGPSRGGQQSNDDSEGKAGGSSLPPLSHALSHLSQSQAGTKMGSSQNRQVQSPTCKQEFSISH